MNHSNEDIDLLELLLLLWDGKWIITVFVLLAVLSGGAIFFLDKEDIKIEEPIYQSNIIYSVNSLTYVIRTDNDAYLNFNNLVLDFQNIFLSKDIFNQWKNNNNQSQITFEEISNIKPIDGIIFEKSEKERFVNFELIKGYNSIIVRTNNINLISEIFSYANFVSDKLTSELVLVLKDEKEFLSKKMEEYYTNGPETYHSTFINKMFQIDKYITAINKGQKVINIENASEPIHLNKQENKPKKLSYTKLAGFAVLGALLGSFLIFIKNAIRNRKEKIIDG